MAACPKCGASLKAWSIRGRFACHACATPLRGHIVWPLVATLVLWQLADFFLYPLFQLMAGPEWSAVAIRTAVSACVGFPLYAFLVSNFANVQIANGATSAL